MLPNIDKNESIIKNIAIKTPQTYDITGIKLPTVLLKIKNIATIKQVNSNKHNNKDNDPIIKIDKYFNTW